MPKPRLEVLLNPDMNFLLRTAQSAVLNKKLSLRSAMPAWSAGMIACENL